MGRIATLAAAAVLLLACGDGGSLTADERAWCSFADDSEESAERFDLIFEAGLALDLEMDPVNARAAGLRAEYEAEGLAPAEAISRVSDELLQMEAFVEACRAAYQQHGP